MFPDLLTTLYIASGEIIHLGKAMPLQRRNQPAKRKIWKQ
jgi:hypothetical protein